jgi:hypothetical protein
MAKDDGDTIRSMRLLALVAIASSACSSAPTLSVVVQHPDGIPVASTEVTVYESETLACTDAEFGILDAAQLEALVTADETLEPGGATTGSLDGISRTNNKVIVARGFDTTGALVSAGCLQEGTISGNESVTITTIAAASVALQPSPDETSTIVTATDPSGALIDGRAISWTVYGPAGSMPASSTLATIDSDGVWDATNATCTADGSAAIHIVPPGSVAGYAVQMRVAWATSPAPLFTNVAGPAVVPQALPLAAIARPCAIRHSGTTQRLVCVDSTSTATDYTVSVTNGAAMLAASNTQAAPTGTVALVSVPNNGDLDVYAVDNNGDLAALFGAPAPTNGGPAKCLTPGCIDDAMVAPACGNIPGRIVLHAPSVGDTLRLVDFTGTYTPASPGNPFGAGKVYDAGCIAQLEGSGSPTQVQAIVSNTAVIATNIAVSIYACNASGCTADSSGAAAEGMRGSTIGFIGGTEPRLIAESVDATGVVLIELILSSTDGVIERSRMPAAAAPTRIVSGQFDTDGQPDLVWDVASTKGTAVEIAYSRQVDDEPLEALSSAGSAAIDDILVGDLTGDGIDDLVLLDGSGANVAVVPIGMPAPSSVTADPPCSP